MWHVRSLVGRFNDSSCERNKAWRKRVNYTGFGGKAMEYTRWEDNIEMDLRGI
jgi:hypothetical protein